MRGEPFVQILAGGVMVRIGATVQPTAPERATPVTEPFTTVAVAVGRVLQVPHVIETVGEVVYPEPPCQRAATVPVGLETAYA